MASGKDRALTVCSRVDATNAASTPRSSTPTFAAGARRAVFGAATNGPGCGPIIPARRPKPDETSVWRSDHALSGLVLKTFSRATYTGATGRFSAGADEQLEN